MARHATHKLASAATRLFLCLSALAACGGAAEYPPPPEGSFLVRSATLTVEGRGEPLSIASVEAGFFDATGVAAYLGRPFTARDHDPGARPVVVIGHDLWTETFAAAPDLVGRTIELDGGAYTVVGVMPPGYDSPPGVRAWLPRLDD